MTGEHAHHRADDAHGPADEAGPGAAEQHDEAGPRAECGCQRCPLCALLQAVPEVPPEVSTHLRSAGWELARALQVWLERPAAEPPGGASAAADDPTGAAPTTVDAPNAPDAAPGPDAVHDTGGAPQARRPRPRQQPAARVQRIPLE